MMKKEEGKRREVTSGGPFKVNNDAVCNLDVLGPLSSDTYM